MKQCQGRDPITNLIVLGEVHFCTYVGLHGLNLFKTAQRDTIAHSRLERLEFFLGDSPDLTDVGLHDRA